MPDSLNQMHELKHAVLSKPPAAAAVDASANVSRHASATPTYRELRHSCANVSHAMPLSETESAVVVVREGGGGVSLV